MRVLGEAVAPRVVHLGRERLEPLDGPALETEVLGMLERHVQKDALDRVQGAVLSGLDAGDAVGGPACASCAKAAGEPRWDVARHLIEQDHQRKPSLRRAGPVIEGAPRRILERGGEPGRAVAVEGGFGAEPDRAAALQRLGTPRRVPEPESRHVLRGCRAHRSLLLAAAASCHPPRSRADARSEKDSMRLADRPPWPDR